MRERLLETSLLAAPYWQKAELTLSTAEQEQLTSFARLMPAALSLRARIVLACAAGQSNTEVARRFESTNATVGKWRRRFVKDRISGLYDEVRPGKPRSIDDERIAALIHKTLHKKPKDGSTHWSVRTAAADSGISAAYSAQVFDRRIEQRTSSCRMTRFSSRSCVPLSACNALVLCVDEKSQLERTQPMLAGTRLCGGSHA